jgi:hypothetical protein
MYFAPDALSSLEQQQLVAAVMLADKLGAADVAEQAVQKLLLAAEQGMSVAALEALASLVAWPACLQPLLLRVLQRSSCCDATLADLAAITAADTGSRVQRMLLAVLGDLEAVWEDKQLQQLLLALPLPALQLLLSSDQLRVTSEDTVLYTASKLVAAAPHESTPMFREALAPLVRAPHLSGTMLSVQALSSNSHMLLGSYSTLKRLITVRIHVLVKQGSMAVLARVLGHLPRVPAAWQLGQRQIIASDGVRLVWRLPVEWIAKACRDSFAGNRTIVTRCTDGSPPLGGVSWSLQLRCHPKATSGAHGTGIVLDVVPHEPHLMVGVDTLLVFTCSISCHGITQVKACPGSYFSFGFVDFFKLGIMSAGGGWDEAAWAAKGLPTSGELEITLHMLSVGA